LFIDDDEQIEREREKNERENQREWRKKNNEL
jgi:hypothetical protein